MEWPSFRVTIAFFTSERRPTMPRTRFSLPFTRSVFTVLTLTLNRLSTEALISGLVASSVTRNVSWLCSEQREDFSVITGERMISSILCRVGDWAAARIALDLISQVERGAGKRGVSIV